MPHIKIRCAIVGYGPVFNFGKAHAGWIRAVPGLELVAVCDRDPERAALAGEELPGIRAFTSLDEMLAEEDIDLVSVVVPHNLHHEVVVACLRAGKHTVVDKPMAITVAECDEMIAAAREVGRTLAVFHNRRHDGNYRAICRIVESGKIGKVFRVEANAGGYGSPGSGWRTRAVISGGALYDWGGHAIDWVLNLIPSPVTGVTGFAQKLVWTECDIEDEARATLRFANGAVADVTLSYIAAAGKPLWYILGTRGAIIDTGEGSLAGYCPIYQPVGRSTGSFTLVAVDGGSRTETRVPYDPSDWVTYYADLARHLIEGGPAPVTAEEGRRVVAILEAAKRSAQSAREVKPAAARGTGTPGV